jgi:cytochrome c-type biogenesis protein CcmE
MMNMTRKGRRGVFIFSGLGLFSLAAALALTALSDSIIYFYSPTDLIAKKISETQRVRVGGLVKKNSKFVEIDGITTRFIITDLENEVTVKYKGVLPDLFREGQGVVTEGQFDQIGIFIADKVLAKHDENYMPREVADSLRKSGVWKGPNLK